MTEWRLFLAGETPRCSTLEFFQEHPWISPADQHGHAERMVMVENLTRTMIETQDIPGLSDCVGLNLGSLSDLGCGDGSFLDSIRDLPIAMWGYDAGTGNVKVAREKGLDVYQGDILTAGSVTYGDVITCNEVVEHLENPHDFIANLHASVLILSSPSAETGDWHYYDHTWAWDMEGYADLVHGCGWRVVAHEECDGGINHHNGETRPQRFQAIMAVRP